MHSLENKQHADNRTKIRIQIQHHHNRTQHTDAAHQKVIRALKRQLTDLHDVARNTRKQLACACIIKKAERHFLQMLEQVMAHIILNAGAHHASIIVDNKKQDKFQNI